MKKLLLLYNPAAGTGKVRQHLGEIVERFIPFGYEVTLHPTTGRGDATTFARERAKEFDRIVCAGGDGTLNEVVSGLLGMEDAPPLGYIPTGTTNDFSRTLGLPANLIQAADCSVMGTPVTIDMGRFNGRTFVYVAAFGIFSDVSYTTPQEMKNMLGHLAYMLSGLTTLASVKPVHMKVEYDGGVVEDDFIYGMVSDTVSVGGVLELNKKEVCLTDGKFEVTLVRNPVNLLGLNSIVLALATQGTSNDVISLQTTSIRFTSDEDVRWTLDGEYGGDYNEAVANVLPHAVTLVVNADAPALKNSEKQN